MKKARFIVSLLIICIGIVSAGSYVCSDNNSVLSNSEEVREGAVKNIQGLKIGVCDARESNYFHSISSLMFIDAVSGTIPNASTPADIVIGGTNLTVSYIDVSPEGVNLTVSSTTAQLPVRECSTLGNYAVMVSSVQGVSPTAQVDILIGATSITIDSRENASALVTYNNREYIIDLIAGSSVTSTIRASTCRNATILRAPVVVPNILNSTNNITEINVTQNITQNASINQTVLLPPPLEPPLAPSCPNIGLRNETKYCTVAGVYAEQKNNSEKCGKWYECVSNYCASEVCAKKGFFRNIIDWVKELFTPS